MRVKKSSFLVYISVLICTCAEFSHSSEETASTRFENAPHYHEAFQKSRQVMHQMPLEKLREIYFSENNPNSLKKRIKIYQKSIIPSVKEGLARHETLSLNTRDLPGASETNILSTSEYLVFVMLCEAKLFYLSSQQNQALAEIQSIQKFINVFSSISTVSSIQVRYRTHYALNCLILRMIYDASSAQGLKEIAASLEKRETAPEFKNLILTEQRNIQLNMSAVLETIIQKSPENRKFKEKALKDLRSETFVKALMSNLGGILQKAENISFVSVPYAQKKKAFYSLQKKARLKTSKLIESAFPSSPNQKKYIQILETIFHDTLHRLLHSYETSLIDLSLNDLQTLSYLMKLHKFEHQAYPEQLSELTRSGFKIPRDPFTGKYYHYRKISRKAFRIWSIGPDQKDDQASEFFSSKTGRGDIFLKPLAKPSSSSS